MARSIHPADHILTLRANALALRLHGMTDAADRFRQEADEAAEAWARTGFAAATAR